MTGRHPRILPYSPELAPHFRRLNLEWIERLFTVEAHDLEVLDDPEGAVMTDGGEIFFALMGDEVVGCCAAIREPGDRWELSKMAVDPEYQGRGIGEMLGRKVIEYVLASDPRELYLVTNSSLHGAIRLYQRLGFEHRPLPADTGYARGDVMMVYQPTQP
ncbi:MAG TPA: GNAT family N-acetyltransferase [Gemmatimonadales bacterium]|nr:GNAT family N-acetyltransferase [Gemmatimonadales bacterium]